MQHEHYTHTAPNIPSPTALSIFFFLLMQLLFLLLILFQDFLHNRLRSRPILHTEQFDRQITHDHSIMAQPMMNLMTRPIITYRVTPTKISTKLATKIQRRQQLYGA